MRQKWKERLNMKFRIHFFSNVEELNEDGFYGPDILYEVGHLYTQDVCHFQGRPVDVENSLIYVSFKLRQLYEN